jgi:hypothetical protein
LFGEWLGDLSFALIPFRLTSNAFPSTIRTVWVLAFPTKEGATMNQGVTPNRTVAISQPPRARLTGVVYLLYFLTAIAAQTLTSRNFVAPGNAVNLIAYALYVLLALLFYSMFKPVSKGLSLLAALASLAGSVEGVLNIFHRAPANLSPLWFFGFYCILIGYLVVRSNFLPKFLGWLMLLAGLGWLGFLYPPIEDRFSVYIEVLGILAEAMLMLWLVIKGVNAQRWRSRAEGAQF